MTYLVLDNTCAIIFTIMVAIFMSTIYGGLKKKHYSDNAMALTLPLWTGMMFIIFTFTAITITLGLKAASIVAGMPKQAPTSALLSLALLMLFVYMTLIDIKLIHIMGVAHPRSTCRVRTQ